MNKPKFFLFFIFAACVMLFAVLSVSADFTDDFSDVLEHTWKRNTGSVGIAICGCYGAGSSATICKSCAFLLKASA